MAAMLRRLLGGGGGTVVKDPAQAPKRVLIVGNPNVGKSAVFNWLTGRYATVSNYPGTTVEIARGRCRTLAGQVEVVDTPGMYGLLPITDEERVARRFLLEQRPQAVIHVLDAKNISRMLPLSLQLIEAGLPLVVALNMMDEALEAGIAIDCQRLQQLLGVPVVATAAIKGSGMAMLVERVREVLAASRGAAAAIDYGPTLEQAIARITPMLGKCPAFSARSAALLCLQGDDEQRQRLAAHCGPQEAEKIQQIVAEACSQLPHAAHYHVALAVKARADELLKGVANFPRRTGRRLAERLGDLCMNPWTGLPLLVAALYLGLYEFVGQFGAGTLVDWLENGLFQSHVNPWVTRLAEAWIPWPILRDLFIGDYGIFTLGLRYAIAIIFPIVGTFFLVFSIFEDSGYLPRLAMLIDRVFKRIGLNGRAVIPMVLGFGCGTMAIMVTRTLESRRERIIATLLLGLAIPCSAQMGVVLGLLAGHPWALAAWGGVVGAVFLLTGMLAARVLPGPRPSFYMELPPLRLPRPGNVLVKTYTRMVWYFKEVLPLFVLASAFIWIGRITGLFQGLIWLLTPMVRSIGLPNDTAAAFLFGFFRRDYGVAGLYDLHRRGLLAGNQLAVAAITMTLFLPCVAQLLIMKKERGAKMAIALATFIGVVAFGVGFLTNLLLTATGVRL